MTEFQKELQDLINKYSQESGSDTPDWILAEYLADCLTALNAAIIKREQWYGRTMRERGDATISYLDDAAVRCNGLN